MNILFDATVIPNFSGLEYFGSENNTILVDIIQFLGPQSLASEQWMRY